MVLEEATGVDAYELDRHINIQAMHIGSGGASLAWSMLQPLVPARLKLFNRAHKKMDPVMAYTHKILAVACKNFSSKYNLVQLYTTIYYY